MYMEPINPKDVPLLAQKLAKWYRIYGPRIMLDKGMRGSRYAAPPSLPPLVHNALGYMNMPEIDNLAFRIPDTETISGYVRLAAYYAETLERANCFNLSPEMTSLALRTTMPKYKLTLDMLPLQKPWGFIVWGLPVGAAERHASITSFVNFRTGEVDASPEIPEFSPYADVDLPVVAATWRYEPEANSVWVAWYTQHVNMYRKNHSPEELRKIMPVVGPLSLEREQELPLDRVLNWCDGGPDDGPKLTLTVRVPREEYPEHTHPVLDRQEEIGAAHMSDLVRVLIASWMLVKWKIAHREVIPPPPSVVREISKATGKPKAQVAREAGTTVVRLGAPIHQRSAKPGEREYQWDHRTIVGPVVRHRQYIPAWDTYDEEPRLIEPFFMGPPDAPIRNIDKVFLLE